MAYQYREPVFTHDNAIKAWGKSYWSLSGRAMLSWIRTRIKGAIGLDAHAMYDQRKYFNPVADRCVCWCLKPAIGEIPEEITNTYIYEIETYPSYVITEEERVLYLLQKSWAHLIFKWDTMSVPPQKFNLLLAKLQSNADYNKLGLAILDTRDLYINYNPIEWFKKYNEPYPVDDLEKQKEIYSQWITYSGFQRLYLPNEKRRLIPTPWYYRVPVSNSTYGFSIQEYPEYRVHPLKITGGTFIPQGYEE